MNASSQLSSAEFSRGTLLSGSQEHSRLLAAALPSAKDPIFIIDKDARLIYMNEALLKAYDYAEADLLGHHLDVILDNSAALVLSAGSGAGDLFWEGQSRSRTASLIPVSLVLSRIVDEAGTVLGHVGILRDVSKQRMAEDELRRAERGYRELVEMANDLIFTIDPEGRFRFINRAGQQIFGPSSSLPSAGLIDLVAPDQQEMLRERLKRVFEGQDIEAFELEIVNGVGKRLTLEVILRPILERRQQNSGRSPHTGQDRRARQETQFATESSNVARPAAIGAHGIARDITARKELETRLRRAQKMEAMGMLAGGIAHDFNNLLAVIMGHCEVLEDKTSGDFSLNKSVQAIQNAGARAAALTSHLLGFSRRQALQLKVLNLNTIVLDAEPMLRRLIGEDIEATAHLEAALGHVKADSGQLFQIIMNLAANAREAMPKGGQFNIATANATLSEDVLYRGSPVRAGKYVSLAVSDTGMGMDTESLARLSEPLFTGKESGRGTVLGLATVFAIAEQNRGYVFVESGEGKGTTVRVLLPRVEAEAEAPVASAAIETSAGSGETILLVEDDADLRALIAEVLKKIGYKVLVAVDGADALHKAEAYVEAIALVITDVVMPQMSGPELVNLLRANRAETRVLYMSGYTDDKLRGIQTQDPNTPFIQKPFKLRDLAAKARELLLQERGARENGFS